jgi:hypothetical protein
LHNSTFDLLPDGSVRIFQNDTGIPSILQPHWPDGTAWKKGEAEAWAEQFILAANDETADLPGDGPDQPTKPRPIIEAEEAEQDSE